MNTLYLIRGLPGSGKTTLGKLFGVVIEADAYFQVGDRYEFNAEELPQAHAWCQRQARMCLAEHRAGRYPSPVVCNTFSCRWELEPYLQMASEVGARVTVIDLFDAGCTDEELFERCTHDVPLALIREMRGRWEHDWKNGNPLPPWER